MSSVDKEFNSIISNIDVEDFSLLLDIEEKTSQGLLFVISYMVYHSDGTIKSPTVDLLLPLQSLLNNSDFEFSFEETERLIAVGSELCVLTVINDQQTIEEISLGPNSPVLALIYDDYDLTLNASLKLSEMSEPSYSNSETLTSLSLFGHWEQYALMIIQGILKTGHTYCSLTDLKKHVDDTEPSFTPHLEFADLLDTLSRAKLLTTTIDKSGTAFVKIRVASAGLFLVFSGNREEAYRLSELAG